MMLTVSPAKQMLMVLMFVTGLYPLTAGNDWRVVRTIQLGGAGGWDYLISDPLTHLLYVPRTTHTMVFDEKSGKLIADIAGQKNAHGVALAPSFGRGFISDGAGAVIVFDLKTHAILGTLAAMEDADGIIFDGATGQVLVVSGRGKALMTFKPDIDPKNGRIGEPIALHGEPEFLASDESGKVFINLMTTNEVAVVDLRKRSVLANWPIAPGGQPVGIDIDRRQGLLFIGCRGPQKLIVMSTKDGRVLSDMPIGPSVDAVKLIGGQVFASTAGAQLFVAGERPPGKFEIIQTVTTGEGARTMAVDQSTHSIFLPTAEFEPGANGKRVMKPDTFRLVVVAQ